MQKISDLLRKEKGITLVALVITIIVLIILATVAINITLGDNGIFQRAKTATKQMNIESAKEKLETEKASASVRTKGQRITLSDYVETVREDNVADDAAVASSGDYAVVSISGYIFKVEEKDNDIVITYMGTSDEIEISAPTAEGILTITLSKTGWTNENVTATANGSQEGYTVHMSTDGTTWTETNTLTIEENTTVYACLYNGIRYGAATTETVSNIDKQKPAIPTITNPSNGEETSQDVTVTVTTSETGSGIAKYQAYYNGEWHDRNETSNTLSDIWNIDVDDTVKYRVIDNAGNISDEATTVLKITKIAATISNMTNGDLEISATVALSGDINYTNTKYAFTTSNDKLGTNDASLYTDGTISQSNSTVKATKKEGTYYLHVLATSNSGYSKELISEATATSQGKKNFTFTGAVQDITLTPGNYKLELWGAQGGSNGGKGGYATGDLSLSDATTVIYAYVGGQGASYTGSDHVYAKGGWPNGGDGYTCTSTYYSGGGGGRSQFSIGSADNAKAVLIAGAGASGDRGCSYGYRRRRNRWRFLSWYTNRWWRKCRILLWW